MIEGQPLDFLRQLGILDPSRYGEVELTVIGAGGIGSPTLVTLTKMGFSNITVWDDDTVAGHNVPNQFYRPDDIGRLKVEAIADICRLFSRAEIKTVSERYQGQKPLSGIVICGVDSMAARKMVWENVQYNPSVALYIEARMAGLWGIVNTVHPCDPDSVGWYETTLYSDDEVEPQTCTDRAIAHNVQGLASLITNQVRKYVVGEGVHKEIIFDLANVEIAATA